MKNVTIHMLFAAAALVAGTTVASAQAMNVEIPFAFQAGKTSLAAGSYALYSNIGDASFRLSNRDTRKTIFLMASTPLDPKKSWVVAGNPVLEFVCGESGCALEQVWTGGAQSHKFKTPKLGDGPVTHLSVIRMVTQK